MGTNIGGDLGPAQLEAANNEIKPFFNGQIPGYFNGKRAKYTLESEISADGNFISLNKNCYGNLKDFFEPDKLKYWQRYYQSCGSGHLLQDTIGRVFPYYGVVVVNHPLYSSYWDGKHKRILKSLQKLGYVIAEKRDTAFSHRWCNETKRELLKAVRQKGVVDPRIRQIVNTLRENIGADVYTFAHYNPRAKIELMFGPYCELVETGHKPTLRTFDLPDERLEPFQGFYTCDLSQYGTYSAIRTAAGIASTVKIGNTERHIPMIDFRNKADLADVEFDLAKLNMPGVVVDSGNSYHFYGFEAFSEDSWRDFINETQKLRSVDEHWPSLQLEQGFAMLRITPAYHRLFQPCVVKAYKPSSENSSRELALAA